MYTNPYKKNGKFQGVVTVNRFFIYLILKTGTELKVFVAVGGAVRGAVCHPRRLHHVNQELHPCRAFWKCSSGIMLSNELETKICIHEKDRPAAATAPFLTPLWNVIQDIMKFFRCARLHDSTFPNITVNNLKIVCYIYTLQWFQHSFSPYNKGEKRPSLVAFALLRMCLYLAVAVVRYGVCCLLALTCWRGAAREQVRCLISSFKHNVMESLWKRTDC